MSAIPGLEAYVASLSSPNRAEYEKTRRLVAQYQAAHQELAACCAAGGSPANADKRGRLIAKCSELRRKTETAIKKLEDAQLVAK